ncbi:MAG: cysteine--tRNA ligase [Alphaproteobacteria bacterium]|jgi:cysteinyl-tRNA synthetase|nr:cysteine--tRNA ligase [Alphaproteobacteria bacterium]MDP6564531.1 cysteine--tRNA ligase [Alphaproteobacteria bacterium]MDP6811667.1 cysteine--tRNA ligase [Alphaproteobacteria bacterium]
MSALQIHNTANRRKESFEPLQPDHVRLYVCGPTVYDHPHVGNARPVVVFDSFVRLLRRLYPKVTYVRNITDIEDKIIDRAAARGISIAEVTAETIKAFHDDVAALNALSPDHEPRATDYVTGMIAMTETLLAKGNAYEAEGHVLFDTASMADYGAFARRSSDELIAGARVEVAPYKRNPTDFVLWKPSDESQPGWDSPWGKGRPGWHLECSVMSEALLGETFDIHGGGVDLVFPHHQNEIAQSTCAHDGALFAKYWMHNGHVTVGGEKMSKSLGNFLTVHELLKEQPGEAIRLSLLSAHYRQPLDFTREAVGEARRILDRWYRAAGKVPAADELPEAVLAALCDDMNTPRAITEMHRLADAAMAGDGRAAAELRSSGEMLGVLCQDAGLWFQGDEDADGPSADEIEQLIARRAAARRQKDFATSDRIRDELADQGIVLEDAAGGTTWRRGG